MRGGPGVRRDLGRDMLHDPAVPNRLGQASAREHVLMPGSGDDEWPVRTYAFRLNR
jgi:hypothetical protein